MSADPLHTPDFIGLTKVAPFSRRGFMTASAAVTAGYTLAAGPVRADVIKTDTDGLTADRDQLFAQALHEYRSGTLWWPDGDFERQYIAPEQDARFEPDPWEQMIRAHLETVSRTTVGEIARSALQIETPRIGTTEQRRIAAILERLGWHRLPKDWKGNRYWAPPAEKATP